MLDVIMMAMYACNQQTKKKIVIAKAWCMDIQQKNFE